MRYVNVIEVCSPEMEMEILYHVLSALMVGAFT